MDLSNKKVYFEFMRIIAIALVIFNHLAGYTLYQISSGAKQWVYMTITMITRINVPLFLMISGALLLRKNEEFPTVIRKRFLRFLLLITVFEGAFYSCYKIFMVLHSFEYDYSLSRFITGMLANTLEGTDSYWYLYSYIGMLLILPFMQRIAKKMSKSDFAVLIVIHAVFWSFLPIANMILLTHGQNEIYISGNISVPFSDTKAFFYPLLGYYLEYNVDYEKLKKKHLIGLIVLALVGIAISNVCTYWEGITTGAYTQNYVQLFDYLTAIVAFIVIRLLFIKCESLSQGRVGAIICCVGSLTLGMYLLDPFLKLFFCEKYQFMLEPILPTLIVSFGWIIISMIMGGILTAIIKKIPGLKKLI